MANLDTKLKCKTIKTITLLPQNIITLLHIIIITPWNGNSAENCEGHVVADA